MFVVASNDVATTISDQEMLCCAAVVSKPCVINIQPCQSIVKPLISSHPSTATIKT